MVAWIGPAISAGASLLGGWMNSRATDKANAANLANQQAHADRQIALQKKFAQEGIRWRVEDAKKAGIHPLYALGAQTPSYTPVSASFNQSANTSMGSAMANAGQDIGRAINATRTGSERMDAYTKSVQALNLKNLELDTQIKETALASSVQRLRQQSNPPIPGVVPEADKYEERPKLSIGGVPWQTSPGNTPGKAAEDQYQDVGNIFAVDNLWRDYWLNNGGQPETLFGIAKHFFNRADAAIRRAPLYGRR